MLVSIYDNENSCEELKVAILKAFKNSIYCTTRDQKKQLMKEITYPRLISFLDHPNEEIQTQALIIFRNLMTKTDNEIKYVLDETSQELLNRLEKFLSSASFKLQMNTIYILC